MQENINICAIYENANNFKVKALILVNSCDKVKV